MKRSSYKKTVLPFVMGISLLSTPAFAGVDYIQYKENFQMQKEAKSPDSAEGKHFQRTSKQVREQGEDKSLSTPQRKCGGNTQVSKYDRCYWNPTQ